MRRAADTRGQEWSAALAIAGNALLFALAHVGNTGVTVLAIVNIFLIGVLMSLVVYYMDSLWAAMALHTAWNFTQAVVFGLPNSGWVNPYSVFSLDMETARNSFAYHVEFGIEGTIAAAAVALAVSGGLWLWGQKHGRRAYDPWAEEEAPQAKAL